MTGSRAPRRWRLVRARPDAVPLSARRFMARARRRRVRAALPWAAVAGVLAVVALLWWAVYRTPLLGVDRVTVTGTGILSTTAVTEAVAVPPGTPLAGVDLAEVRERVAVLPPVERVTVRRDWPRTLAVEVVERTAVAVVARDERFLLVDRSGVAFHSVDDRPAGTPLLKLAGAPSPGDPTTRSALAVLASLTKTLREQVTTVSVDGPARIRLALRGGREVVWGDATENDTKARVATALLERDGGTIDVSAPDVVTIR